MRMGVEHLDICLCHDVEFVDMAQIVEETLPALRKVQQQGKVRLVGVSGYPMKMFRYVLERAPLDLILSYNHYTLQNTMLADLFPYATGKGTAVMNAAPFSARLLTNDPLPAWHKATPEVRATAKRAADHCRARGRGHRQVGAAIFDSQPGPRHVHHRLGKPGPRAAMGRMVGRAHRRAIAGRNLGDPQADSQLALHGRTSGK